MNVKLINYTFDADRLLVFAKRTRLSMELDDWDKIAKMPQDDIEKELKYVFGTIGSSWEFVEYVFLITGVSRAFTHQLVRHRHASYAQQSMRTVDMSNSFGFVSTGKCQNDPEIAKIYNDGMRNIKECYSKMIARGAPVEDARGILPTNIVTNILAKFNLRALSEMMMDRLCVRTQGEFQLVARMMKAEIVKVHPWADPILQVGCVKTGFCKFYNFKTCPMKTAGYVKELDSETIKRGWQETTC